MDKNFGLIKSVVSSAICRGIGDSKEKKLDSQVLNDLANCYTDKILKIISRGKL